MFSIEGKLAALYACRHDTHTEYSDQPACCVQVAFCQAMMAGTA